MARRGGQCVRAPRAAVELAELLGVPVETVLEAAVAHLYWTATDGVFGVGRESWLRGLLSMVVEYASRYPLVEREVASMAAAVKPDAAKRIVPQIALEVEKPRSRAEEALARIYDVIVKLGCASLSQIESEEPMLAPYARLVVELLVRAGLVRPTRWGCYAASTAAAREKRARRAL